METEMKETHKKLPVTGMQIIMYVNIFVGNLYSKYFYIEFIIFLELVNI